PRDRTAAGRSARLLYDALRAIFHLGRHRRHAAQSLPFLARVKESYKPGFDSGRLLRYRSGAVVLPKQKRVPDDILFHPVRIAHRATETAARRQPGVWRHEVAGRPHRDLVQCRRAEKWTHGLDPDDGRPDAADLARL